MEEQPIVVEIQEVGPHARYRVLRLNRPERLNAFVKALLLQLRAALEEAGATYDTVKISFAAGETAESSRSK